MNILITGGTGFVGEPLVQYLLKEEHQITLLTRGQHKVEGIATMSYPAKETLLPPEKLAEFQTIINLAGTSISTTRWNAQGKKQILDSRIQVTKLLVDSIRNNQQLQLPYPTIFISTSAVGYYGTSDTLTFEETSPNGSGFLAEVANQWEIQASQVDAIGVRRVILRFGIVLGNGGILEQLSKPFQYGVGGFLGTGKQWVSWIHLEDLIRIINWVLLKEEAKGTYNACAPNPATMKELIHALAVALHRKSWTRVPSTFVRILIGEMAEELVLHGQRVNPKRLLDDGFQWKYERVEDAMNHIYRDKENKNF
jgi:uncharacterized protein (TIGR01777 family)